MKTKVKTNPEFWSYKAATETPIAPSHISEEDWQKLSPGMRREIARQNPEWWKD